MLDENAAWEKEEAKKGNVDYWTMRRSLDYQIDGIYDGYMMANKDKPERVLAFSISHLVLIQMANRRFKLR